MSRVYDLNHPVDAILWLQRILPTFNPEVKSSVQLSPDDLDSLELCIAALAECIFVAAQKSSSTDERKYILDAIAGISRANLNPVFADSGDEIEARLSTENNCPHCGGSGHADDVQNPAIQNSVENRAQQICDDIGNELLAKYGGGPLLETLIKVIHPHILKYAQDEGYNRGPALFKQDCKDGLSDASQNESAWKERAEKEHELRLKAEAKAARQDTLNINSLVSRFLMWKLPSSVCSDPCVSDRDYKFPRNGTNLLSANEARQMIEYLLDIDEPSSAQDGA